MRDEGEAGSALADRFFGEFLATIGKIQENPRRYPPMSDTHLRRANLANFPYHVLYEEHSWGIKVMVLRHHRRSPDHGLRRQ